MNASAETVRRAICGVVTLFVLVACCGCDSGSGSKTEYKPLEGGILNKLNKAGQDQSQDADAKKASKTKRRR